MSTVQELIEAAYVRSTANDPGKLAQDAELIGHLNRTYQGYFALMSAALPDANAAETSLTCLGTPATATLPADVIDLLRVETAAGVKVALIPVVEKDRAWHLAPAMYRVGRSLVSRGLANDPAPGTSLTLFHLDAPAALTARGDTLDDRWPVRFDQLLVVDLALYLATKDEGGRAASEIQNLQAERAFLLAAFTRLTGLSMTGTESPHAASRKRRNEDA